MRGLGREEFQLGVYSASSADRICETVATPGRWGRSGVGHCIQQDWRAAGGDEELCGQVGAGEPAARRSTVARFASLVLVGGVGCATSFGDAIGDGL